MSKEEFMQAVEERIGQWFEDQKSRAPSDRARDLISKIQSLVQRGGKRSRPELMCITYQAYGGKDASKLVDIGAALELYHQFLLVHDDIMDKDTERYGGPNIVGMYESEDSDIAQSMGILAGDLLFTYANQLILESQLPEGTKHKILERLHSVNADEMFGQQLDIFNVLERMDEFNEEQLVLIHTLKTARYTTQLPLGVAAIVLDLPEQERNSLNAFATLFGVTYQLTDDYSDYFENKSSFSARKHRDYRSGKVTMPIFLALKAVGPSEREVLLGNFGNKQASDESIQATLTLIEGSGARQSSREFVAKFHQDTKASLESLALNESGRAAFGSLLEKFRV